MYRRWEPAGDKRSLRRTLKLIKRAKTWQLVIILILLGFVAATFLRLNNLGMIERRNNIAAADKAGNNEQIKAALVDLQRYVSAHMNTSLGKGISLSNTFQRDYDRALKSAADAHNQNSDVYQQAAITCRQRFQGGVESFRNDYVACVANAVSTLPPQVQQTAALPNPASYQYNFASPVLSFDLAGFFVILCFVLTSVIIFRLATLVALRWLIKHRAKLY